MASESSEASCEADPNFAIVCAFLEKFGGSCGLQTIDFVELQHMLENTQEVSPVLVDLHVKLMRKIRKSINPERWERGIIRHCHSYSSQDAWEIERFGYKKARLSAKLRLLKELMEKQFDNNPSFKNKINNITAKELRSQPLGKDKLGNAYWYQIDDSCQIRVYKEDPDEETWALVAKDRDGLVSLISKLSDNHDSSSSTDAVTNEDSNSNNEETKTVLDTGQQDSNSSKKSSSDDDKPPELVKQECADDEDTKMEEQKSLNLKMPELAMPTPPHVVAAVAVEEKKPEVMSGIKEKYMRSDNFVQSNRKAVESAGFVDIADLKRPADVADVDIDELSLVKRPRTIARPTLLGNKKKPYLQPPPPVEEEEEEDDEDFEDEEVDEEEEEDDEEEDEDEAQGEGGTSSEGDDSEVGEEIEEPLMLVTGKGNGEENQCECPIVGEAIEEEVMYFAGVGSGVENETGNEERKEEATASGGDSTKEHATDSIISPTKNSFKLGMISDSKTTDQAKEKQRANQSKSRWDVGKPDNAVNVGETVKDENVGKSEELLSPPPKKAMFFFGPGSGFSFKTPAGFCRQNNDTNNEVMKAETIVNNSEEQVKSEESVNDKVIEEAADEEAVAASTSVVNDVNLEEQIESQEVVGEVNVTEAISQREEDTLVLAVKDEGVSVSVVETIEELPPAKNEGVSASVLETIEELPPVKHPVPEISQLDVPQEESPTSLEVEQPKLCEEDKSSASVNEPPVPTMEEPTMVSNITGNIEIQEPLVDDNSMNTKEAIIKIDSPLINDESTNDMVVLPITEADSAIAETTVIAESEANTMTIPNANGDDCNQKSEEAAVAISATDPVSSQAVSTAEGDINSSIPQETKEISAKIEETIKEPSPPRDISVFEEEVSLHNSTDTNLPDQSLETKAEEVKLPEVIPRDKSDEDEPSHQICNDRIPETAIEDVDVPKVHIADLSSKIEKTNTTESVLIEEKEERQEAKFVVEAQINDTPHQEVSAESQSELAVVFSEDSLTGSKPQEPSAAATELKSDDDKCTPAALPFVEDERSSPPPSIAEVTPEEKPPLDDPHTPSSQLNQCVPPDELAVMPKDFVDVPSVYSISNIINEVPKAASLVAVNEPLPNVATECAADVIALAHDVVNYPVEVVEHVEQITVAKSFLLETEGPLKKTTVVEPEDESETMVIQEIGSITNLDYTKATTDTTRTLASLESQIVPADEEEDVLKIRHATHSPPALQISVENTQPPKDSEFVEIGCVQQKVALLTSQEDDNGDISDGINCDDEPVPGGDEDVLPPKVEEERKVLDEPKKVSLQSLSLDFTGEAPDLSEVQAMVRMSRKRTAEEEAANNDGSDESGGGKRRKIRGRRTLDKELRKSIEDAKNKEVSSSEEEEENKKKKQAEEETQPPKAEKKKGRRRRNLLGLDIPEDGVILDVPTGPRQSRRIAQIKIKEEAERRKLEEIALDEMKNSAKRKSKKDEDKPYKGEKRKHAKPASDDETTNDTTTATEALDSKKAKKKKKKRRKHREFDEKNPWRSSSSDSSSEESEVEHEEEEEEETYIGPQSDHEFSPESDLENAADPQPLKRARTARKEDEEAVDEDANCQKCHKSDHPEWILLCDGCDSGWHCSCLRPALLVIPEGDWYCPPCQHGTLIKLLQDKLVEFDKVQSKKVVELRRKERLAYVGISLANVLPEKSEEAQKTRRDRPRPERVAASGDDRESESGSASGSNSQSGSESDSSSDSSSSQSSSDSDEPIYKLRQRRQAHSYRFKDYDEMINSAIQEEVDVKAQNEPVSKGKDMATIVQAEALEAKDSVGGGGGDVGAVKEEDSDGEIGRPVAKILGKKKHRKLNSLDISSEEDEDSDEDFKGSSSDDDEDDEEYDYESNSSSSSIIGRKGRKGGVRRSTRARISRYDRDFINDDSEDSDIPKGKRRGGPAGGGSDWEETDESEEESDGSWDRKKKRSGGSKVRKPAPIISVSKSKRKKSKKKRQGDSDGDTYRRKKPKIKFGGLDDDDSGGGGGGGGGGGSGRRRTRGKKINYLDALGTDSEEENRRRHQVKDEESEDEFVLNEEEEDVRGDDGREDGSSTDSNIGGLVPAVKKGSKKGMGKGGIKRIKRAQVEEEEALFPPLPDAPAAAAAAPALLDIETNPIEQINKSLEAMDEKEIGMMMEEEEYANKQLQMVAAQLEKEKRRKEMEAARKLEMMPQPAAVPLVQDVMHTPLPSVIQAVPVSMPPQHMHHQHMQPMHRDLPLPLSPMHNNPLQMHHSPQHFHTQSPQHLMHMHAQPPPAIMAMDVTGTPKKRGRKPKSMTSPPELLPQATPTAPPPPQHFLPTQPQRSPVLSDKSDELSFNSDGTPKKRRGRGKGKKTLEKEAAAAAALAVAQGPSPTPMPVVATPPTPPEIVAKDVGERVPPPAAMASVESKSLDMSISAGKLGVASAPQPFSQSQPKPSVITRMLQTQPGQPAYPVGGVTRNFVGERPPFVPLGPAPGPGGLPPRGIHPSVFRGAANHYPVIRSGAPPSIRPNLPPHLYHHPMEGSPVVGGSGSAAAVERSSPALVSPASASPLSNKSDQTPPPLPLPLPPPYAIRPPPMVRFPPATVPPRLPQLLPQLHPQRSPYGGVAPPPPGSYHYAPQFADSAAAGGAPFQHVPPQYQEPPYPGVVPDAVKNYQEQAEEENGEFGGLVSYFSSQREDDLDT